MGKGDGVSTRHLERIHVRHASTGPVPRAHVLAWYAGAAGLFFAVPVVGTDWWELQPDLFYLGYFTVALAFLVAFVVRHATELEGLWPSRRWQSVVVGAAVGAVLAAGIFQGEGAPRAEGWRFGFEIVWRGLVYGTVDALTLFVLPAAVAYLLMRGDRTGAKRRIAFAGLTLVLSMLVTATYHLGYGEFRDGTIRYPEIGAVMANVPTAVTGNPLGAVVTHTTMHVSAVVHMRDGGAQHMLPPRVGRDYGARGDSDLAAGLAAAWLAAAAVVLGAVARRRRVQSRDLGPGLPGH